MHVQVNAKWFSSAIVQEVLESLPRGGEMCGIRC